MIEGAIVFGLAIFTGLAGLYFLFDYRAVKKVWKRKVEKWYTGSHKRTSFLVGLGDKFDRSKYARKMEKKLKKANIVLTPSEFYGILFVGAMALTLMIGNFLELGMAIAFILSLLVVRLIQFLLFMIRSNKYQEQLNNQLSEICRMLSNATRSGMTIQQGITLVSKEMDYPANEEFKRLSQEMQLGVDFDRALLQLQDRVDSRDFKLFIATLQIQKRAGGNLSEVLDEMANTLEERKVLQQTIQTMTAEQKYISWILPLMPIALILVMNTIVDGFLDPLFTVIGGLLFSVFVLSTVTTYFLIKKVTNIRV